jgi:ketosteroid isomerase-like protein
MKKTLLIIALFMPVICFAQHTDHQLIVQLRTNWAIYLQNKQLDKAISQFTDDAIFYSPDGKNAKGKKEITKLYQFVMKQFNSRLNFHSDGISISGDTASDGGDYNETMFDNTSHKSMKLKGSYLMVLQKQRNSWLISKIMWTAGN